MAERDEFSQFDESLTDPVEGPPAPPAPKGPEPEPNSAQDRISQLTQERNDARKLRDEAIRKMLDGAPAPAQPAPEPAEEEDFVLNALPSDSDPDVADVLRPVLAAHEQRIRQEFEQRYGPAMSQVERDQNINVIEQRVEGFRENYMADVEQMFKELPPEQQAEYDNRLGIEALALRAKVQRMSQGQDLSGMAHSAPYGATPPDQPKGLNADTVWDMPDNEFDAWMEKVRTSPRR